MPDDDIRERESGVQIGSLAPTNVMEGGVFEMISEEVKEGGAKILQVVLFGKGINRDVGNIRLSVDIECGP